MSGHFMCDGTLQFSPGEKPKNKVIMYLAENITAAEYLAEVIKAGVERFGEGSIPAVVAENATSDNASKSEIMNALHESFADGFNEDKWWNSTHVLAAINKAKPAEQRTGKWLDPDFCGQLVCSECGNYSIDEYDYCPYCGARMKEDDT